MKLRDYQTETHERLRYWYDKGYNRLLAQLFTGAGKGQPLTAKVKTPSGEVAIGDLSVGDSVIGSDGKPTTVTGIFDRGILPTYRVRFNDETYLDVDGDHLWTVYESGQSEKILTTLEIKAEYESRRNFRGYYIPIVAPVEHTEKDLPLDPYVLGVLIGDGGISSASVIVSSADDEILFRIAEKTGYGFKYSQQYDWRIDSPQSGRTKELQTILKDLGLWGKASYDKFIPEAYMFGSKRQRLDLLRGLMDADGYNEGDKKSATFTTTSVRLANQVAELVRSLGGVTRVRAKKTNSKFGKAYNVTVNTPDVPFYLPRKAEGWKSTNRSRVKRIVSVELIGAQPIRCIRVDAPDSLYVTEHYIVTHNTSGIALHLPNTFPDLEKYGLLFLSHRREILFHAYKKFEKYYAGRKWVGLEMGEHHATGFEDYVFASIDSLGRLMSDRIFKYERRRFGIIVVDEGHHATEDSIWDNILTYSGVGSDPATHFRLPSGDKPLSLFLTATPERPDGRPLTALVDAVPDSATGAVVNFDTLYAIRNGWLVDIRAYQVWSEEANIESLSQEAQVDYLVKAWLDYARDKRTLVFARSVAQSQLFAETLRKIGINAAHIDATTPKEERDVIMPQFDGGPIQVVSNRLVFCLDEETEILTSDGWKGIDELTYGHKVANYNIETGEVYFKEPEDIIRRRRFAGERMVTVDSPRHNFRVTERHRMIHRVGKRGVWRKSPAIELVGKPVQLPVTAYGEPLDVAAEQPEPLTEMRRRRLISAAAYNIRKQGFGREESYVEAERRIERKYNLRYANPDELTLDECRFVGFFVGDGTRTELQSGGIEYSITASAVYPNIIKWFDEVINRVGVDVRRREYQSRANGVVQWSFPRGTGGGAQERKGVFYIEPYLDKNGSKLLWGLNREQFAAFIEGFWYADGNHRSADSVPETKVIYKTNEPLLSLLQAIASVRGFRASLRKYDNGPNSTKPIYSLSIANRPVYSAGPNSIKVESDWKDERIWCVTTETKNIITRRRGYVTVMGNTEGYDNPSIECVLDNAPAEHFSSHLQKLGRGLRPSADARVDDYDSASERKAAIARSSKPELLYISTFNPTIHRVDIVSTIWGVKRPIDAEGSKVVEDVIDVIEHEEEEAPERPTREIAKISELSVVLRRADVWNQTVYNEKLKALTPLRWVICDNSASIYLPRNPFSSALDEQTPVIARFEQTNSGEWAYYLIVIGGWVSYPEGYPEKLKRGNRPDGFVARAKVKRLGKTRNIGSAIRRFDAKLKAEHPDLYAEMLRGKFGPATEEQIRYLKNHSIGYGNNLTEETASILIDDYRIRKKMETIKL